MSLSSIVFSSLLFVFTSCAERGIPVRFSESGEHRLHAQFLEARARMDEPYVLAGEDVERLYFSFREQLRQLGDTCFAAALSNEPSDVIAAVAGFIDFASLGGDFPQTRRLCSTAPKIPFPATKITEEDRKRE